MTERPRLAQLATDALAAERERASSPPSALERARAIALIAGTIAGEARARRRRRFITSISAVAAAAACTIVGVGLMRRHLAEPSNDASSTVTASAHALVGAVAVIHEGRELSADSAASVVAGDRIVVRPDARAGVTLSTGTHLVVEGGGELEVIEQDATQIFSLRAGAVQADVAKLHAGERFVVRTTDAEIEVRGTSFHLAIAAADASCGDGAMTRLRVTEGVVVVRVRGVEDRIGAGESWPRGCGKNESAATTPLEAPAATGVAAVDPSAELPGAPTWPPAPSPTRPSAPKALDAKQESSSVAVSSGPSKPSSSELRAQNDLFAQATDARTRGDVAGAIAAYERYLARYPQGALAESAVVERMRLLASVDKRRGALAAKAYLAQFSGGFARTEAEGLASGAP